MQSPPIYIDQPDMCSYYDKYRGTPIRDFMRYGFFNKEPVRKKRVKCPTCGRKLWAWASICHDGCCVTYVIPPHKKKGWWKKKLKKQEKRISPRGR